MKLQHLNICSYCGKSFPENKLERIYLDDNMDRNLYCSKCKPEVEDNIRSLPWIKNKWKEDK